MNIPENLDPSALAIPTGFVILAAILLWFIIGSKGYWWLKFITIAFVMYFGIALWYSIDSYLGWPSRDDMPPKYMIYWAHIQEPDKKSDDDGAIFFWVRELETSEQTAYLHVLDYQANKKDPRVYRIPYSREAHKQVQQMIDGIKKGKNYIGGKNAPGGDGDGEQGAKSGNKSGKKGTKGAFSFSYRSKDMYIYPLPPPKIPEKIIGQ